MSTKSDHLAKPDSRGNACGKSPNLRPALLTLTVLAALTAMPHSATAACTVTTAGGACGPGDTLATPAAGQGLLTGATVQLNGAAGNPITVSSADASSPLFITAVSQEQITFSASQTVFNTNATLLQADAFDKSTLKLENATVNVLNGAAPVSWVADPWATAYVVSAQTGAAGAATIELDQVAFNNLSAGNVMNLVYANSSNTTPGPQVRADGVTTTGPLDFGFVVAGQNASLLLENSQLNNVNINAITNRANDNSLGTDISQVTVRNSTITGTIRQVLSIFTIRGPVSRNRACSWMFPTAISPPVMAAVSTLR